MDMDMDIIKELGIDIRIYTREELEAMDRETLVEVTSKLEKAYQKVKDAYSSEFNRYMEKIRREVDADGGEK